MPAFIEKNQKQFSCYQANHSRMLTKRRWVIEAINGVLKESFRALGQVQNSILKHIMIDLKICCSFINRFFHPKLSDRENGVLIAKNMKLKLNKVNELEKCVNCLIQLSLLI